MRAPLLAIALGLAPLAAYAADTYPDRTVTIVVPNPPGGMNDITARPLATAMQPLLGQPVVVVNKPGGTAAVGTAYVASQKPDGHHLLVTTPNLYLVVERNKVFGDPQPFKLEAIAKVALLSADPLIMVVQADSPYKTVADLVKAGKEKTNALSFSSSGPYGITHVPMAMFLHAAGLQMRHLPTTGGGPALRQLLGGHVNVTAGGPAAIFPHVSSGKMRALASWGEKRHVVLKDVPTLKELGYDAEAYLWVGMFTTAGAPAPVMAKLRDAVGKAARSPDFVKQMGNINSIIDYRDAPEFERFFEADHKRLGAAVAMIGKEDAKRRK